MYYVSLSDEAKTFIENACFGAIGVQNLFYFREGAIGVQNLFCIVNLNGGQAGTRFWVCLNSSLVR